MLVSMASHVLSLASKLVLRSLLAFDFVVWMCNKQEVIFDRCDYSILGYFNVSLFNKTAGVILKSRK